MLRNLRSPYGMNPPICPLSVCDVVAPWLHPTQRLELFGNILHHLID